MNWKKRIANALGGLHRPAEIREAEEGRRERYLELSGRVKQAAAALHHGYLELHEVAQGTPASLFEDSSPKTEMLSPTLRHLGTVMKIQTDTDETTMFLKGFANTALIQTLAQDMQRDLGTMDALAKDGHDIIATMRGDTGNNTLDEEALARAEARFTEAAEHVRSATVHFPPAPERGR